MTLQQQDIPLAKKDEMNHLSCSTAGDSSTAKEFMNYFEQFQLYCKMHRKQDLYSSVVMVVAQTLNALGYPQSYFLTEPRFILLGGLTLPKLGNGTSKLTLSSYRAGMSPSAWLCWKECCMDFRLRHRT